MHNEESAAFAASAEAQLTGRLAVCAGSCGPGNTHLIQGVFDAHRSGVPVLAIASHIVSTEIGTGFFQETDPKRLFEQASHWTELLSSPAQMPRMARVAIQNAVGLEGAAVLVVPGDVLSAEAANETGTSAPAVRRPRPTPAAEVLEDLAARLNGAGKVAIFGGIGCADAREEVLRAGRRCCRRRSGTASAEKSLFSTTTRTTWGCAGLLGYGSCYEACHEADVLLLLGTDFPYRQFLPQKNTIQVDIDPSRLGRRTAARAGRGRRRRRHDPGAGAAAHAEDRPVVPDKMLQAAQREARQGRRRRTRTTSSI